MTLSTDSNLSAMNPLCSSADLPVAPDDVLVRGELAQRHGPARMQLLGGDADLRAEAELGAICEARGRVHRDRAAVDFAREPLRRGEVARDDGVGVRAAEAVHMVDGGI